MTCSLLEQFLVYIIYYLTREGVLTIRNLYMPLYKSSEFGQVIATVWVDDIIIPGGNSDVYDRRQRILYEIQNRRLRCVIVVQGFKPGCKQGKCVKRDFRHFNISN